MAKNDIYNSPTAGVLPAYALTSHIVMEAVSARYTYTYRPDFGSVHVSVTLAAGVPSKVPHFLYPAPSSSVPPLFGGGRTSLRTTENLASPVIRMIYFYIAKQSMSDAFLSAIDEQFRQRTLYTYHQA